MKTVPDRTALRGWYVISLRPAGEHSGVRRAATARGADTFAISTLALRPIAGCQADLIRALSAPTVIFTSPAAVRFTRHCLPEHAAPSSACCAVGAGTARLLRRWGVAEVAHPTGRMDSEALLQLAPLHAPRGRRIGLISAPGGRDLIESRLRQAGARVWRADVYRRQSITVPAARRLALTELHARSAVLVSSAEALDALWRQLSPDQRDRMCRRPAVAASARLSARLTALGFRQIEIATSAQPEAMLTALAEAACARRFR